MHEQPRASLHFAHVVGFVALVLLGAGGCAAVNPTFTVPLQEAGYARAGGLRPAAMHDVAFVGHETPCALTEEGRLECFDVDPRTRSLRFMDFSDAQLAGAQRALYGDFAVNGAKGAFVVSSPEARSIHLVQRGGAPIPSEIGVTPSDLAAGDFDGDAVQDLAVLDVNGTVSVALGVSDGTFRSLPGRYTVGNLDERLRSPGRIATADLNGDGILDIAVATPTAVVVLLGVGDGAFSAPQPVVRPWQNTAIVTTPEKVWALDLDGDGKMDLLVEGGWPTIGHAFPNPTLSVYFGTGDGIHYGNALEDNYSLGAPGSAERLRDLALGDYDGDGRLDVAAVLEDYETPQLFTHVFTLVGKGGGKFGSLHDATPTWVDYADTTTHDFRGMRMLSGSIFGSSKADLLVLDDPGRQVSKPPNPYAYQIVSFFRAGP